MRKVFLVLAALPAAAADISAPDFFETKVRPVLAKHCFACHAQSKLGGLEATSREGLLKGGKSGPAIVPGKPDESLLIKAVNFSDGKLKMPMQGGKLKDDEIGALSRWIRDGAVWPESAKAAAPKAYNITPEQKAFWSFQPVQKPAAPKTKGVWAKTEIDRFILAKLEEKSWKPAPAADRRTLIRRATFDLTGLPPTPEDVDAFLADKGANAFAKVVDRLLDSPHYGERWGR